MQINPQALNNASNVSFGGDVLKNLATAAGGVIIPIVAKSGVGVAATTAVTTTAATVGAGAAAAGAAVGAAAIAAAPVAIAGAAAYGLYKLLSDD